MEKAKEIRQEPGDFIEGTHDEETGNYVVVVWMDSGHGKPGHSPSEDCAKCQWEADYSEVAR